VYTLPTERKEKEMVMYEIGTVYPLGTKVDVYGDLPHFEMYLAVNDDDYGYDADLSIRLLPDGEWEVKEACLAQLVERKFDGWVYDRERNVPIDGTGFEVLATALSEEYGTDRATILAALRKLDVWLHKR
jgi:hypothetical protein